jgi:hypothetical protein
VFVVDDHPAIRDALRYTVDDGEGLEVIGESASAAEALPQIEIHRDRRWWDDPGQFRPIEVPGGTWRRAAGIITQRRNEPSPAASALIGIIESICAGTGAEDGRLSAV